MRKGEFCNCLDTLRQYAEWERKMYECGLDFTDTPVGMLAENLTASMCDFNPNWSYDEKLGIDWIIEWSYTADSPNFEQTRHGRTWRLDDAGILYDFLEFMNEYGWED